MSDNHRLGRLRLSPKDFDGMRAMRDVAQWFVVVRAEHDWAADAIEYTAWSHFFDVVGHGEVIPWYDIVVTDAGDKTIGIRVERRDDDPAAVYARKE